MARTAIKADVYSANRAAGTFIGVDLVLTVPAIVFVRSIPRIMIVKINITDRIFSLSEIAVFKGFEKVFDRIP